MPERVAFFMRAALKLAKQAYAENEVPIGAVIVKNDQIIGKGRNQTIKFMSPIKHAEIQAIESACQYIKNFRLPNSELFVTVEPCHMCAKAIVDARITKIYFGACEPKTGAIESQDNFFDKPFLNHTVSYSGGYLERESSELLKSFFRNKR